MVQHSEPSPFAPRRSEAPRPPLPGEPGGASGPILIARRPIWRGARPNRHYRLHRKQQPGRRPECGAGLPSERRRHPHGDRLVQHQRHRAEQLPDYVPGLPLGGLNLGPDDTSSEVVATPNGRFLFAVNQGSNSVSSFRIRPNGALELVGTFASGGVQPDSLGIAGNKLYVSNRGDSTTASPAGTVVPNITGFRIYGDGSLRAIRGSTVTFAEGTSPSQNLVTPNGRLLFSDVFGVPGSTAVGDNTLAPFQVEGNGALQLAPGGNVGIPDGSNSLLLGAAFNPDRPIIYVGVAASNEVAVFTYTKSGQLTYVGAATTPLGGGATCWDSTNGRYLYVTDTVTDSVSVFSLANPLQPVQIQQFAPGRPASAAGFPARHDRERHLPGRSVAERPQSVRRRP